MAGRCRQMWTMLLPLLCVASSWAQINQTATAWSTGLFKESDLQRAQSCWSNYSSYWMTDYRPCLETASLCGPTTTTKEVETIPQTTTLYPTAGVSTYKLCDGIPRANLTIETSTYNSYYTLTKISQLAPDGKPLPTHCMPGKTECDIYHFGSNLELLSPEVLDERILLGACGQPLDPVFPCLIQGGPARLIYFPVTTAGGDLCKGNGSTIRATDAPNVVTTLGTEFTSGTAYISFETLYAAFEPASYDEAGALQVGPTFTNAIFPFQSSEVSTNCFYGGPLLDPAHSHPGYSPGTQLNFADLNYPVPASAYKCANECLEPARWGSINGNWTFTYKHVNACHTIWDNFNPLLAVPTRLREIAPEWEKCKFWHYRQANIIFDPPIAVRPAQYEAIPTLPGIPGHSTPPSPSPTPPPGLQPTATALPDSMDSSTAATNTVLLPGFTPSPSTVNIHPVGGNQFRVDGIPLNAGQTLTKGNFVFHVQGTGLAIRPADEASTTIVVLSIGDGVTATFQPDSSAVVVDGKTISKEGPPEHLNGATLSLATGGLVLNGSTLTPLPQSTPGHEVDQTVTVLLYGHGSDAVVATLLPAGSGLIVDSTTLTKDAPAKTVNNVIVSVASDGIKFNQTGATSPNSAVTTMAHGTPMVTTPSSTTSNGNSCRIATSTLMVAFLGMMFVT